jgi:hypothetical protein
MGLLTQQLLKLMQQWTQPKQNGESLEKELKNGCCWQKK